MRRALNREVAPVICVALACLVALIGTSGGADIRSSATVLLINMVFVVGLYVFVGNSGILSFGHMAFAAVGAYAAALLTIPVLSKQLLLPNLPELLATAHVATLPAMLIAGAVGAILAVIFGIPLMRLTGIAAAIGTFAALVIVYTVLVAYRDLTGGDTTLTNVPVSTTLGVALVWAVLAIVVAWLFQKTRVALFLRAARDEEVAARATGVAVTRMRLVAFVVSAFVVGVGGALQASYVGTVDPDQYYVLFTFQILTMLVIGGLRSLSGAVLGTIVVSALSEVLRRLESGSGLGPLEITTPVGTQSVALAIFLLAILIWRPAGLTGGREFRLPRRERSARTPAGPAPDAPSEQGLIAPRG